MKLQEQMFAMVQSWQESGLSRREFLSDKSIGLSKFAYWINKYRKHTLNAQLPSEIVAEDFKTFFLSPELAQDTKPTISMEIETPSGVRITIYE